MSERFHQFWFGVKLEYVCSLCCITSVDKLVLNSTTPDIEKIKAKIESQSLSCLHCAAPLGHETDVDVQIVSGIPEYLRSLGFQIPTVPISSGRKKNDRK